MAVRADPRIVIVGCGISGIAAAHRLISAGFHQVQILEATARSGGRIKTEKLGNYITDIGASYIHGPSEENPVFCLARGYGLLDPVALTEENQTMVVNEDPPRVLNWFSSSGQKLSAQQMMPAVDMFGELKNDMSQITIQEEAEETQWASEGHFIRSEALQRAGERWKEKTTRELLLCAISTLLKKECCDQGTHTMEDVDLAGFAMIKYLPGLDCTLPSGFEGLVENLMSELPAGVVSYNRPVTCIHWNNMSSEANTVMVECDGAMVAADHVIVTVPIGYLKRHHSTLFSPPLPPHKLNSIEKVGFGTCNKIYVEFESPWWDPDCEVIYLVWKDEWDLSVVVPDIVQSWVQKISGFTVLPPSDRNSHILCGWIAGQEAEYMETLTEQEVRRSITELVCKFTGNPTISPKRILRTQWFHEPWTCGSYSYPKIGSSIRDRENIMEPLPVNGSQSQSLQVLFSGEATHPYHYGTVHGAVFSGWREADRIISHYSSITPCRQANQNI